MVIRSGDGLIWNEEKRIWEDPSIPEFNLNGKRICPKCNKPRMDINGVEDCDFCLQLLTQCDLIDNACCGHGCNEDAYISFKDGRRWILDKHNSYNEVPSSIFKWLELPPNFL